MKYKELDCYVVSDGGISSFGNGIDGLLSALKKRSLLVYGFRVHRRESVNSYVKQLLSGVQAHIGTIQKQYGMRGVSVDDEKLYSMLESAFRGCLVDMTGTDEAPKDKNVKEYWQIKLTPEDLGI